MDTLKHDAPFFSGMYILQQLLLYVNDVSITLAVPAGLQY